MDAGYLRDDLVEGGMHVVGELQLGQGHLSGGCHPHRQPGDERLGDRCVEASVAAESVGEALGCLENTALGVGDVLAEHHGLGVGLEDLVEGHG